MGNKNRKPLPAYSARFNGKGKKANISHKVIISQELMSYSRQQTKIDLIRSKKQLVTNFEDVILRIVKKAFVISGDTEAREFYASLPGVSEGKVYHGAISLHRQLPSYQKPILHKAMELLLDTEDPTGLQLVLALLQRGANECTARKQFVFSAILDRVVIDGDEGKLLGGVYENMEPWRRILFTHIQDFLEDLKDKAFRTVFLEPTKFYFRKAEDPTAEGDVDVHGANTYLAILEVCLGVQLRRSAYLDDEAKGTAAFLDGFEKNDPALNALWDDKNLGKSFEGIGECVKHKNKVKYTQHHHFLIDGPYVRDVVQKVSGVGFENEKKKLDLYLDQFLYYFSEDYVLQAMYGSISVEDRLVGALNEAFKGCGGEGDVRYWLWDMEADPPVFQKENAKKLFGFLGVLGQVVVEE